MRIPHYALSLLIVALSTGFHFSVGMVHWFTSISAAQTTPASRLVDLRGREAIASRSLSRRESTFALYLSIHLCLIPAFTDPHAHNLPVVTFLSRSLWCFARALTWIALTSSSRQARQMGKVGDECISDTDDELEMSVKGGRSQSRGRVSANR
ncbi:hypothetical protein CBOM_07615 [Ceraceosorus bombacis]|uniref:Uncharacterized protein n=1 Tax=Ceraceosorus bombacis TaxID=401625 RepID=A0A0P1BH64_9BASI|nr:hypothetical protein CBOM_07615 [Ceraceosorus bombacis]